MRLGIVAAGVVAVLLVAGCDSDSGSDARPGLPAGAPAASPTAAPVPMDVAQLPLGDPPTVTYLAGGQLHWRGRTVATDLTADASLLSILGSAGDRLVLTGYAADRRDPGTRFWALDASGHAVRLGRTYETYDYAPVLVPSTGHLWVHYSSRGDVSRTIWELDARTGDQLGVWADDRLPRGLAPADQALVDAWVARRDVVPGSRTRDGSLAALVRSSVDGTGHVTEQVVVRRVADREVLARFALASPDNGGVGAVVFAGRGHVLVQFSAGETRRSGPRELILRCTVADGTCERATEVGGAVALGVVRPQFAR